MSPRTTPTTRTASSAPAVTATLPLPDVTESSHRSGHFQASCRSVLRCSGPRRERARGNGSGDQPGGTRGLNTRHLVSSARNSRAHREMRRESPSQRCEESSGRDDSPEADGFALGNQPLEGAPSSRQSAGDIRRRRRRRRRPAEWPSRAWRRGRRSWHARPGRCPRSSDSSTRNVRRKSSAIPG